jgi:hypothetical protein
LQAESVCERLVLTLVFIAGAMASGASAESSQANLAQALHSVGRLLVPAIRYEDGYPRHYDEQCSATLIRSDRAKAHSDLILSAWHCVEDYRDLTRPLLFLTAAGDQLEAIVLASGGSMHSDWVLLRLASSLPQPVRLAANDEYAARLVMAGYPRAVDRGQPTLRQTAHCRITGSDRGDKRSDCVLRKGASGGAVLAADSLAFIGVISRGDGATQSIYVPVTRFRERIKPYLAAPGSTLISVPAPGPGTRQR